MDRDKVLVVDDGLFTFELIDKTLGDKYQIFHARNGEVGLKLYAKHQPILILLDLNMPIVDGFEFLRRLGVSTEKPFAIIVLSSNAANQEISNCYQMGITSFLRKPFNIYELKGLVEQSIAAKKNQQALKDQADRLENLVQQRTAQLVEKVEALERTKTALSNAMGNLLSIRVAPGVFWLQIPEAGLYILCGCPSEVVKHLVKQGLIQTVDKEGVTCETGPNVILLSELLVQNGGFSNLSEFPVLQMLYRQGMILPGHPNNTGIKPMLIGCAPQVQAQMAYIHRGNYGLISKEEILACGVDDETAENMMKIKMKFAFGSIRHPSELLDALAVDEQPRLIRNGVTVCRVGFNRYQFAYQGRTTDVDLNLPSNVLYQLAYSMGHYAFQRQYFSVIHRGEGDGWDSDRASMSSIIMFQGRIYLIDAAPGVFYNMLALGIDISEVEGIFHTHAHDDHFAGLPALIHAGHRLKYFATPLVRSAVAKKFTALMSMEEEKFGEFFDICDLDFDVWNSCDGLEVMPFYSPHPIETNLFLFRALDGDGYKTYAHWADLSSFKVLDGMVGDGPNDVPAAFINQIKKNYKYPADLKKLDVGGGMIHGVAEDFRDDKSGRLILAHVARKFTIEEMEIGSETSFGAMDVLIPGGPNYLYQRAFRHLRAFFPEVDRGQIEMLLNSPVLEYNSGTILHRYGESPDHVDMVLAGTVSYLETESDVRNHLAFGSLIGIYVFFGKRSALEGTYRAASHCSVVRFSSPLFRAFLENNGISKRIENISLHIWFLRRSWLFGEQTSFSSLGEIARAMERVSLTEGADIPVTTEPGLWLVLKGEVLLCNDNGKILETVNKFGFFGEYTYFSRPAFSQEFKAKGEVKLYRLHFEKLLDIPIIHWKMLEVFEKRNKLSTD